VILSQALILLDSARKIVSRGNALKFRGKTLKEDSAGFRVLSADFSEKFSI